MEETGSPYYPLKEVWDRNFFSQYRKSGYLEGLISPDSPLLLLGVL